MAEQTDGELVSSTQSGDRDAYGTLVARYQGHVYGLAYSLAGNWADAQDIAQETFIRAYVNLDQLNDPARFAAWLRRVTFSVAMNWLKAYRRGTFEHLDGRVDLDALEIPDFRPGPQEVVEKRELAEAVRRAIDSLPPRYRVPLSMFHLDGLSYQKVADFLDIPLGSVKVLIHRARKKLRALLPAELAPEVSPVVQEVFNEHRLPAEFARRVLEKVPQLGWRKGKECTFAGALEAALAATDHPCKYTDIMGFTALAFRVRWFCGNERGRWCTSSPVGEMDEEIIAASKATGWPIRWDFLKAGDDANVQRLTADMVASINAGRPVLAYEPHLNLDVVYGYEEGGKMLLLRDYFKPDEPLRLPVSKLGFLILFLGEYAGAMPRRAAVVEGLRMAAHNWRRGRAAAGPGEYWYGDAALAHWTADLGEAEQFTEDLRKGLFGVSWWNLSQMHDARRAAVLFLRETAGSVGGKAGEALGRAAALYEREVEALGSSFILTCGYEGPWSHKSVGGWTAEMQRQDCDILTGARETEEAAIAETEKALAALPRNR